MKAKTPQICDVLFIFLLNRVKQGGLSPTKGKPKEGLNRPKTKSQAYPRLLTKSQPKSEQKRVLIGKMEAENGSKCIGKSLSKGSLWNENHKEMAAWMQDTNKITH